MNNLKEGESLMEILHILMGALQCTPYLVILSVKGTNANPFSFMIIGYDHTLLFEFDLLHSKDFLLEPF
jgi:hypothetical protein